MLGIIHVFNSAFCLAWSLKVHKKGLAPEQTRGVVRLLACLPFSSFHPSVSCNFESTPMKHLFPLPSSLYSSHYLLFSFPAPKPPDLSATTLFLVYCATPGENGTLA